jgi:hypothetical protein
MAERGEYLFTDKDAFIRLAMVRIMLRRLVANPSS